MTETYNYIVVGSGSAGSVVASRLSENPDVSVLLLEAGGSSDHDAVHDPGRWPELLVGDLDWGYKSAPQVHCNHRVIACPRGKMLGGCASHNANMWVRGHRSDFDNWAYQGCVGWDADSVMALYKQIEDFAGGENEYRGTGGSMWVEPASNPHPLSTAFIEAGRELGITVLDDYNAASMDGVGYADLTIKDGRRHNAFNAYLKPALDRENLTAMTGADARRLIIENGRCVGVEFHADCNQLTARADAEVIVCSGAFGSPRLLLLSGIGPADELQSLGISVVADLPGVGRNLQDHVLLAGVIYEADGELPPPRNNGVEATMFCRTDSRLLGPGIQPLIVEFPYPTPELAEHAPAVGYTVLPSIIRPTSRGIVQLTSADPTAELHIDMNFLATRADRRAARACVDMCRELGATSAFVEFRKRECLPATDNDAALDEFVRNSATTYFHPTSSCRMGIDEMSVVDPELKVYGIEGLRVADASIMPNIVSGNTNAASIMIGEKCAEMLTDRP